MMTKSTIKPVSQEFTVPRYRLASYLASGISAANGLPDFNTP
ncbi:hypothetical protein [Yersinia enterocolitica]